MHIRTPKLQYPQILLKLILKIIENICIVEIMFFIGNFLDHPIFNTQLIISFRLQLMYIEQAK